MKNFRFGRRLSAAEAIIAAVVVSFWFIGWEEFLVPFNYIAGTLSMLSYVILFIVWLGSNYIWPPEEEGEEEEEAE